MKAATRKRDGDPTGIGRLRIRQEAAAGAKVARLYPIHIIAKNGRTMLLRKVVTWRSQDLVDSRQFGARGTRADVQVHVRRSRPHNV